MKLNAFTLQAAVTNLDLARFLGWHFWPYTIAALGSRTSVIANWPGVTPAGKVCTDFLDATDLVPTFAELGFPQINVQTFAGVVAPAGTPQEIVDRLAAETTTILKRQEVRDLLKTMGFGVIAGGPASLRARIAREVPMWKDVIEKANIKVE